MDFKDAHEKLLISSAFTEWEKKNKKSYLVHFFAELDQRLMPLNWEVGYYDADRDLITTFAVNDTIRIEPEAQVFKEKNTIDQLDIVLTGLSSEDALHKAREFQMDKYKQHPPMRGMIVLQHIAEGPVWNITFVTQTFCALNIKIDSRNGAVASHQLISFADIRSNASF